MNYTDKYVETIMSELQEMKDELEYLSVEETSFYKECAELEGIDFEDWIDEVRRGGF